MRQLLREKALVLREKFLAARADLFIRLVQPRPSWRILDLGGNRGQISRHIAARVPAEITVADIEDCEYECRSAGFDFVQLVESQPLPFAAGSFDVVVSNSVIEHVTMPKHDCLRLDIPENEWHRDAAKAQRAFADQIRRIGRGYFVQTPHKHFPLELHTWLPFTGWLSHRSTARLIRVTNRFWIKTAEVADWRLLGPDEMKALFPDGKVHVETFLGLGKSVIAFRTPD